MAKLHPIDHLRAVVKQEDLLFPHILRNARANELYKKTVATRQALLKAQGFKDPGSEEALTFLARTAPSAPVKTPIPRDSKGISTLTSVPARGQSRAEFAAARSPYSKA